MKPWQGPLPKRSPTVVTMADFVRKGDHTAGKVRAAGDPYSSRLTHSTGGAISTQVCGPSVSLGLRPLQPSMEIKPGRSDHQGSKP
jgi:hypothetical protein